MERQDTWHHLFGEIELLAQWSSVAPDGLRQSDDANPATPLYTALQEQLCLKFSGVKALADVFVIDHVEKPSEN
jgi:uncharacterized protein (TIGR03435 family)